MKFPLQVADEVTAAEPRGPRIHHLKTWPTPFRALWARLKGYEIRKNDRDFDVGDFLVLHEHETAEMRGKLMTARDTGFTILARVTYMTKGGQFNLPPDICVMSIQELARTPAYGIGCFDQAIARARAAE